MFQSPRSVSYPASQLAEATAWYMRLGQAPYFNKPFYVGFNVGGLSWAATWMRRLAQPPALLPTGA